MSKKTRLDDIDPSAGPFRVPESAFPDASPAPEDGAGAGGEFTDEDVERAMADARPSYVNEGPPEFTLPARTLGTEPEPPAHRAPPPPPPPASWANESKPSLYVDDDEPAPPPSRATPAATGRAARAEPVEASGLVMEIGADPVKAAPVEEAETDTAGSALNYLALGILAMVIGMAGAGAVLFVVLQLTGGDDEVVEEAPEEDVGIPVRRTLNAPRPNFIEDNIREFEEREAAGEDGTAPEGAEGEAPPPAEGEAPAEPPAEEAPPEEPEAAPIGNQLP